MKRSHKCTPQQTQCMCKELCFILFILFLLNVLLLTERVLFKWKMLIYSELQRHNGDWQMFPSISPLIEKFSSCGYSVCEEISVCLYFFSSFLSVLIFYHWPLQFVKKFSCSCSFCWLSNILLPVCLYPYPRSSVVLFFRSLFLSFVDSLLFSLATFSFPLLKGKWPSSDPVCLSYTKSVGQRNNLFYSEVEMKKQTYLPEKQRHWVSVCICVCVL